MPIYAFKCECGHELEKVQQIGGNTALCPKCGTPMKKMPTFPVMVKMKGEGGYPSRRKFVKGSAPYTTNATKAWGSRDPSDNIDYMGKT